MIFVTPNSICNKHKISIAPMMDCTDRHFRMIMRKISSKALLYTEMIVAQSLIYTKKRENFLNFNNEEHPISIQIGGDNPHFLKEAAKMAQDWGYDEINFNVGCPSSKVSAGNFGASLMNSPYVVAKCIESLKNNCNLPVTIKHRIGVDDNDSFLNLNQFVRNTADAGAERFTVHARKAFLKGLNPKENRLIPPLRYDIVRKLKEKNPGLLIEINGGFNNIKQCEKALEIFDGVMIGRSAYKDPMNWIEIDSLIYNKKFISKKVSSVLLSLIPYINNHLEKEGRSWDICKHLINLISNFPHAKSIRHKITKSSIKGSLKIEELIEIAEDLNKSGY
tara:strand:+ start:409 stop:1413 length:1005 start_codon:yes stop_codon:yes gene_type:complete